MIRLFLLFISLFFSELLVSQSFVEAYLNSYDMNKEVLNFSYDMVYESYGVTKLVDSYSMHVEVVEDQVYTKSKSIESYSFDSTSIIIDSKNKSIQLNTGVEFKSQQIPDPEDVKRMVSLATRETNREIDDLLEYSLYFEGQKFSQIKLVVSNKSREFVKMVYVFSNSLPNAKYVDKEPVIRLEVLMKNFNKNITSFTTPLSEFLKFDGERFSLQSKYSNYQFVTNYAQY